MKSVQEKELTQLCQSITYAEMQAEVDRAKYERQEARAGFSD